MAESAGNVIRCWRATEERILFMTASRECACMCLCVYVCVTVGGAAEHWYTSNKKFWSELRYHSSHFTQPDTEDFNVWVWSVWAAWSMAALAQSCSTLNNKWWDRLQAPSLSHTLLLHQSTVVHIMDSRSKLNFYCFQMSTSKCVETCQFQSWVITHGPPDWELEKQNNGVSFRKIFCVFLCIVCFCFSVSLPVSQFGLFPSQTVCLLQSITDYIHPICLPAHLPVWLNCMNLGLYHQPWLSFPISSLVVWLSVSLSY